MSNWFEDNPFRSIIIYTIIVSTVVCGFTTFILDENKVNYYRAESENYKAQLEMYNTKVLFFETEIADLKETNRKYLLWLENTPDSIPFLESEIIQLENENTKLQKQILDYINITNSNNKEVDLYQSLYPLNKGEAIIDEESGLTIGVSDIHINFVADITLTLAGEKTESKNSVKPGEVIYFENSGKKFKITIIGINWYNDKIDVEIREVANN